MPFLNFEFPAMPDATAIHRLLSYYQSPMFEEDFRERILEGGTKSQTYLQRLVDLTNEKFAQEGHVSTTDDVAVQRLLLDGTLGLNDLLELARSFGVASVSPR